MAWRSMRINARPIAMGNASRKLKSETDLSMWSWLAFVSFSKWVGGEKGGIIPPIQIYFIQKTLINKAYFIQETPSSFLKSQCFTQETTFRKSIPLENLDNRAYLLNGAGLFHSWRGYI